MSTVKLTVTDLRKIAPNARSSILRAIVKSFPILQRYGIADTRLRLAHFLAQAALETAGFRTLEEYGSDAYFNRRYGRRKDLGNKTRADGARYHGRGIFQLTGRANYLRYGRLLNIDLIKNPALAARPDISVEIACLYWNSKKLSSYADANNIRKITKRINGGYNGLKGRKRYFSRAFRVLKNKDFSPAPATGPVKAPVKPSSKPPAKPEVLPPLSSNPFALSRKTLKRGMFGSAVVKMQKALSVAGFHVIADGIFGSRTRKALMAFQKKYDLKRDGIAGRHTLEVLSRFIMLYNAAAKAVSKDIAATALTEQKSFSPKSPPVNDKKRRNVMTSWKSYLQSRTLWANFIGLVALAMSAFGWPALGAEDQKYLIDSILKLIEASGFILGAFFRYIAHEKLST